MYLVVLAFGVFIITIGLSTVILPTTLRSSMKNLLHKKWLWPVSLIRIFLGFLFFSAADQCSSPWIISSMGVILILAGLSLPILGKKRIHDMANYALNQKDWILRICGFAGMLFGIFLALAGLPA